MILADHLGELGRAHPVRQRTGRILVEAGLTEDRVRSVSGNANRDLLLPTREQLARAIEILYPDVTEREPEES